MNIEYENYNNVRFDTLEEGDCFIADGRLFMCTSQSLEIGGTGARLNAVMLSDGTMCEFKAWELVTPADAKVVVIE